MIHVLKGESVFSAKGGFIKVIILIVTALIVLGFYGFDLKRYIDSRGIKEHLATPLIWLQDKIQSIPVFSK